MATIDLELDLDQPDNLDTVRAALSAGLTIHAAQTFDSHHIVYLTGTDAQHAEFMAATGFEIDPDLPDSYTI